MLLLAIGLAAVILTHNISALAFFSLCLGMGMLLWQYQHERRRCCCRFIVSVTDASYFFLLAPGVYVTFRCPSRKSYLRISYFKSFLSFSDFVNCQSFLWELIFLLLVVMSVLFSFLNASSGKSQRFYNTAYSQHSIWFQFSNKYTFFFGACLALFPVSLAFCQVHFLWCLPLNWLRIRLIFRLPSFSVQRILAELTIIAILLLKRDSTDGLLLLP